jgi:hypothetical protein
MARKHRKPTMSEVHDRYEAHDHGQQTEKRKKKNHNKNEKARGVPVYPDRDSMYYGARRVFGVGEVARPPRDAVQHNTPPSAYTSPPQKNGTTRPKNQPVRFSRESPLVSSYHEGGEVRPATSSRNPRGLGAHHSSSSQDLFADRHGYYDHSSSSLSSDANYSTQAAQSCTTCDDSSISEDIPLSSSSATSKSSSKNSTHRNSETPALRVLSSRNQASPRRTPVQDHFSPRKTNNPFSASVESVTSDEEDDDVQRRPVHPSCQTEDHSAPKAFVTSTSADEADEEVNDLYTADALPASKQAKVFPSGPQSKPNERFQRSSTSHPSSSRRSNSPQEKLAPSTSTAPLPVSDLETTSAIVARDHGQSSEDGRDVDLARTKAARDGIGGGNEYMSLPPVAGSHNDRTASEGERKIAEGGGSSSRKRTSVSFSTPLTEVRTYGKKDKSWVVKKTEGIFQKS